MALSDPVWLALIVAVPTLITGAVVTPLTIVISNRAAAKTKAAETKAAAEEKAREAAAVAEAKAAEADERRQDQRETWARQDKQAADLREVANQAATAAQLLAEQQREIAAGTAEAARLLKQNNAVVAASAAEQQVQLKSIHTIVNSSFTVLGEQLLSTTEEKLVLQLENADLWKRLGTEASVEVLAVIEATRSRIGEMKATLADRLEKTKAAENQAGVAHAITGAAFAAGVAAGEARND